MKGPDAASRMILAAIDIVNTEGTSGLTTRRVAEAAGVNTAAVNYHFGSKTNLVMKVVDLTLSHLFDDWNMILEEPSLDPAEKTFFLIDYILNGIGLYPGLTRSYLFDPQVGNRAKREFTSRLCTVIRALAKDLAHDSTESEDRLYMLIGQCFASALSAGIVPGLFESLAGGGPSLEPARRSFVLTLVNRLPGVDIRDTPEFRQRMVRIREMAFR